MRFSEYRRLRQEEEQDTGETSGALSMSEQKPSTGRKFTDIMKEREPQKYASMVAERNERKANNVSDYLDKVNSHLNNTYRQTSDAANYINQHKDTYTLDAGDYAANMHGEYDQTKQQAFALMKEAWDNQDLDKDTRKQALDLLLNSVANVHQTDKTNTAFADYMNQFDNKDAFDRTRAAERKQEEAESMTVEELQKKIEETNSMLEKVEEEKKQAEANNLLKRKGIYNIWTSEGLVKPSDVTKEDVDTLDYQKKTYENDIQNYKNMIFQKEQQKALNSLTDKTKDAFEKLYALQTEGYNKDSSGLERVLDNLSDTSPQVQRAYEREEKEKAISALEEQGISSDEFESLYEYYKFARDSESNESKVKEWNSDYENAGTLAKIGMNIGTIASTPVKGVTAVQEMVDSLHYKNDYAPLNTNSENYEFTNYVDTVRNATSQDIDNKVANFLYQTGMSMADFGVLLPLNAVTGNAASLAIMGTNAGTSAAKEATLRGASKEQALMTGLAAGASEVVFEKLSLDHFWDIARKQGRAATRSAFFNILAQAGIEGSEEVFTDLANTFTDNLINGGLSEWYQNMDSYYKQGMSMTEAQKKATIDYCVQLGNSFLGGALSGGLFGTGAVINTSLSGKQSTMVNEDFKQVAEGIDTNRSSYASQEDYEKAMEVQQLSRSLATKDKVTNFEKGLFNQVASELSNIDWNEQNNPNEQIRQISSSISNETVSRAFVADYKEGMPVDTYTRAFSLFYGAGYTDMPFKTALEKANNFTAFIDEPTLYAIHSLGQNQAEEMSKQYASAEQKELVNTMANALGVKVEYQDIPGANGMYKDGVIYISNKTINPSMVVMSHELTHELKETANEEYMTYENYVIDYFKEFHAKDYEALYSSMTEHYGNDEALIREEIAANAAETFLTDSEAVNRFVKENRTIAERIADFLSNFINKLKELYQNYTAKGKAGKMLSEDIEVYEKARDLWYEAVKAGQNDVTKIEQLSENEFPTENSSLASITELDKLTINQNQQRNNTKFMKKEGIEEEIQNWFDTTSPEKRKKSGGRFKLGTTSEVLKSIGLDEVDVYMDHSKIQKILDTHEEMNISRIKNIPNMLENPVLITSSLSQPKSSIVIFGGEVVDGKAIMLSLMINNGKGQITDYVVTSAYGRNKGGLIKYLEDATYYYIDPNKNRTDSWLSALRVQFPSATTKYGSIRSIPKSMKNNNTKFSLKSYADDIGLRFSDKEGGDLFEEIMMGTDNIDYNSVLVNDGSEAYRATMDLINASARILQDGIKAAGSLKDINVTKDMAHAMATHYLDKYSATFDEDTLADNLYNIFAYIQKSENVDYQDMIRVMQEVCKPVIATSQKIDKDMLKQYNDFRKIVKSYPLKLNEEQKAEIASVYDSFRTFKNVNQNKYTFRDSGNYLDNVWSELVEASGYALSYDTPSSEQMLALHNYMTSLEKSVVSPAEDMDNSQVAYDMALNIYTDYFKLIGEDKQAIKNLRTQMQKKITEYKHDIREDYKDRFKKYKEEAELQKQDEINRLQKQIRKLEHERDDARYEADDIAVNLLDGNIEALQYKIGKISKRNAENLAKLNVNNYNRSIQRAMSKQETEIKNHIKKNMFDLQNRLAKPKDNKYIPQGLVRSTIDLCEAVNINTGKSERLAERLDDMSRLYARLKEDKDYAIASEYDENTQKMIDRLREVFKGRNITMLNMQELKEVDGLITQLRFQIVNAGKLIGMEKSKEVYDTAVRCMEEINASEGYKDTKSGRLTNKYITTSLNAKRQFRRMAGYKNDSVMEQLYADLDKGQLRQTQTLMEAARLFDPVLEGEHNQKAVRKMLGKDRNDWIDSGLVYKDQSPVIMPRSFLISLAMQIQNKSYLDHIIYGGLTVPEWDAYMRGDYTTAYTQGTTIRFMPDAKLSFEQRQQLYDEAVKKLKSAVSNMTVYDKEFKQICDKFFHEFTTEKVNEVSLQLNGYKKAVVKNYFPIKTDKNFTHAEIASLFYNSTIEGSSFLNSRTGARNPVLLEDVTQVIQRVSKSTARYYGMAIPVRNFKKIYNVTLLGYQGSTKQVIAKKWGVEGQKFIEKLLTDIESGSSNDSSKLFNKLQGNFAAATLTLNPSVTIKQAASYPTAAYTVGWDALGKAFKYVFTKSDLDTIAKYTPLLWYRNQGNSTQELADAKQSDIIGKVKDKLPYQFQNAPDTMLNWIQKMDTKTVATLWKACEFNVMDTQKNLKQGSEEFYQAVAKVFNQCVEDTQPNYTTLQRPDILRNQNTFLKSIFMFKTQPMQNFGILYDATMNLRAKENNYKNASEKERQALKADVEQARKDFARAVSSQLVAGVVFSAMTLAANALLHRMDRYRDDDDEITIKSLAEMLMSDTLSCLSGALIGGSEIYNVIYSVITQEKYYGISSPTLEMVGDLFNDFVKLTNDIADEDKKGVAKFARTTSIASDILTICGIPINNAGKIVNGIKLHIEEFFDDESGYFNTGFESTKAVQYRKLFNYLAEGDTASYQKQYEKTLQSLMYTKEQDEAESAIKSGIKGNIKDAYLDGTISHDKTISLLTELGDEEAYFTVKKWENADDKEYSKYSELEEAVLSGIGIDEEIKELTDNGVKKDTVNTNLFGSIKEAYKNGDITREKAIRYLLAYKDDFTEDDAYWELRKWDKEDSYANDEKYSKYDDLINAVDSGNFDSVVKEYLEHGLDAKEIKQQISNYYKPLYQEAYLNKDYKKVNDIKVMLNKIRVNGRHIYASPDYLSWNEDAKKKAAEKKD